MQTPPPKGCSGQARSRAWATFCNHTIGQPGCHTGSLLLYKEWYTLIDSSSAWAAAAASGKSLQSCLTLCDPIDGRPPGSFISWILPGKNTGVGCHFLLQCMKVKSESEVTQSCQTLSDPMDCSPPGSSIHWIFHARGLEWVAIAFSSLSS